MSAGTLDGDSTIQDESFKAYYQKNILPLANECEMHRLNVMKYYNIKLYLMLLFSLAIMFGWLILFLSDSGVTKHGLINLIVLVAPWILVYIFGLRPQMKLSNSNKHVVYPKIIRYFDESAIYNKESLISSEVLSRSGILSKFRRNYYSPWNCDYVKCKYKSASIEITSVDQRVYTGQLSDRFIGKFILITLNRSFKGQTIVTPGRGILKSLIAKMSIELPEVHLDNPVFLNNEYEVYSTDAIEAQHLVTSRLMASLLSLVAFHQSTKLAMPLLYSIKSMQCSFFDDKLLIMSPGGFIFRSSNPDKHVDFIFECNMILEEMHKIFKIIDILEPDEKSDS